LKSKHTSQSGYNAEAQTAEKQTVDRDRFSSRMEFLSMVRRMRPIRSIICVEYQNIDYYGPRVWFQELFAFYDECGENSSEYRRLI
jgi:hypothetical protein